MSDDQALPAYYLPGDTAKVVEKYVDRCKNLALVLDKYVERAVIDDPRGKGIWLQDRSLKNVIDAELARNIYQRWLSMIKSLKTTRFDATLEWRMVVGLGGGTVLETDLTLHHLYGIPFIPASALKGLARAYVVGEEKDYFVPVEDKPEAELRPSLDEKTDHLIIQRIFATQERAGTVRFFDALPQGGNATFRVDIMNPHYPDYYNSLNSTTVKAPTNSQSPNPIPFLTVEKTTFTFALAPRDPNNKQHGEDVRLVSGWLQTALQQYGVGGKTSAGYGYFGEPENQIASRGSTPAAGSVNTSSYNSKDDASQTPVVDPDVRKAQGYKRELETLKDVAGQIHGYYQKWQQLTSQEARILLANAIVEKVRKAGREKKTAEKAWYKELLAFIG